MSMKRVLGSLLGACGLKSSGSRRQLHCSLLLYLVLSCSCMPDVTQPIPTPPADCMMHWLLSLNFSASDTNTYYQKFRTERIDSSNMKLLTHSTLKEIDIQLIGHRLLLLNSATSGEGESEMCRNAGRCLHNISFNGYSCSCPPGFSGPRCEIANNGCRGNHCMNGGTCSDGPSNSITCACLDSHHGDLCQHDYQNCSETVRELSNEVERLQEANRISMLQVYDTIRKSTGLRFFKLWREIDLYKIVFILHFEIDGRLFLGVVVRNHQQVLRGVVIYEIQDSQRLVHIQRLGGVPATSFKVFNRAGRHYMLIGNHYDPLSISPPHNTSQMYLWNSTTSQFTPSQEFKVYGIKDVNHVSFNNISFIALAGHDYENSFNIPTYVYHYYTPQVGYHFLQRLNTTAATRVTFYVFESNLYLFVAEWSGGCSSVFRWRSHEFEFELIQEIETHEALDLFPFSVGDNFFVVAVNNRHNYSYNIQSKIYLMRNGSFEIFTSVDTRGATKTDFFQIGLDSFLVFSNSHDSATNNRETHSVIYRIEGAKCVKFQEILTHSAMYVHFFRLQDKSPVLAIANKGGKSALYKWWSLSHQQHPEGNC